MSPRHSTIDRLADRTEGKIIDIRLDLHQNPELRKGDETTSNILAGHLRPLNLDEVKTGVVSTASFLSSRVGCQVTRAWHYEPTSTLC